MLKTLALLFLSTAIFPPALLLPQQADMVLVHGTVLTVDAGDSVVQAIAVRDGRIVAAGSDAEVMKLAGARTRIVDLHGRTVTPGMIDTHSHYSEAGAEDLFEVKLDDATSVADIASRVQKRVAASKPGEWIQGRGWDKGKLAEGRDIYAADLDAVSPQNPVMLVNTTGHYATLNSYALRLAGIDDQTRAPANGTIDRDAAGHATGVLKEGALTPVRGLVPKFTREQIEQGILKEIGDLHREGVTAFKDTATPDQWAALHELNEQGRLEERVCILLRAGETVASAEQTLAELERDSPTPREYQHGKLAACGAKIFMDGSAMSRTAWSYEPWMTNGAVDAGNTGYPNIDPQVYRQMVRLFHQAGISVGTHAIGDRAIDWVVDTYAEVEQEKPTVGLRHSIIHAYLPTEHALRAMAALEKKYDTGYPEVQPVFLWWLGNSLPLSLGAERLKRTMPLKTYLEHGVRWAAGTDYGVAPLAPRYGLWASVEREALNGTKPYGTAESVDVHVALRSYTAWAAPELFLEKEVGTLDVGKRADIAVWDQNPYTIPSEELKDLKCEMTIVDGKVVYERQGR
jgi:predicted amidohydrolase YtcJ